MDTLAGNIRRMAIELAVGGLASPSLSAPCRISPGQETEAGEFNIGFSTLKVAGTVNIRISRFNGGYVAVISLREVGQESSCFWSYIFFEARGHYLPERSSIYRKNNRGGAL